MKIYLVTPKNPASFWTYDEILPALGRRCIFPNLSMPTVAGLTPTQHEIVLCDENVSEIDYEMEADIVGITGYIAHKPRMLEIIAEFRRRGRFVVVGGPYASLCPEELHDHCDVVFADEAEETWTRFLEDFEAGCWKSEYRPTEKPDMTLSPMPRFDLLEVDRYHALTIQFARGCPFNCEFCDIIVVYGRRPRAKSVAQLMNEIRECHRLGAKQVFVVDDNFIGNKKLAKQLLREMARWGRENHFPIDFNTEVSLDVAADEELLELLRDAHFTTMFIGIESPRKASLRETKKHQNLRADLVESVRRIHAYGIQVQAGMIVGFDHDDELIFEEQLRFVQEACIPVSMTGLLQAMPKTPLYDRIERGGRLIRESRGDQFVLSNIVPERMSQRQLYEGYRWLVEQLYDFRNYRRRTLAFLLHRGRPTHRGANVRRQDLRRFIRIIDHTVLRGGPHRAWFTLSLLATVLVRRPSAFKEAVSFALSHLAFFEYIRQLRCQLDRAIADLDLEESGEVPLLSAPTSGSSSSAGRRSAHGSATGSTPRARRRRANR